MRRLFWVAVGAGVTVVAVRRANKVMRVVTPGGVADRAGGVADVVRDFMDDVRAGMTERELELRHSLGLDGEPAAAGEPERGGTRAERKGGY